METNTKPPVSRAIWLKERRKMRRIYLGLSLSFSAVMAPLVWFGSEQEGQQNQAAAEYRQDCTRPGAVTSGCQKLTMQIYEHRKETYVDPDTDNHYWLGLRSNSGQTFEVDTNSPQWERLAVGNTVSATVWNGEVEEITDDGGSERMKTSPSRIAEDQGFDFKTCGWVSAIIVVLLLLYVAFDKLSETLSAKPGNETSP